MHDPWGGERPVDEDLLNLLFKDSEPPTLPISPNTTQPIPTTSHPISNPSMARVKHVAQRRKKNSDPHIGQHVANAEDPSINNKLLRIEQLPELLLSHALV